jgi:Protein of unknown function (DUF3096)
MMTAVIVQPLVALIAGILILIVPRLLNYIVAIYLIIIGLAGCCRTWPTRRVPEGDPHGHTGTDAHCAAVPPIPAPPASEQRGPLPNSGSRCCRPSPTVWRSRSGYCWC